MRVVDYQKALTLVFTKAILKALKEQIWKRHMLTLPDAHNRSAVKIKLYKLSNKIQLEKWVHWLGTQESPNVFSALLRVLS